MHTQGWFNAQCYITWYFIYKPCVELFCALRALVFVQLTYHWCLHSAEVVWGLHWHNSVFFFFFLKRSPFSDINLKKAEGRLGANKRSRTLAPKTKYENTKRVSVPMVVCQDGYISK